jgi:hypothetical protein
VQNLSVTLEKLNITEAVEELDLRACRAEWAAFRKARGLAPTSPPLLTYPQDQLKLGKSDAYTVGLTLQSADTAGVECCPWRGECAAVCVLKNGNGRYNKVQKARDVKTQFLAEHPLSFMRLLLHELDRVAVTHEAEAWRCRLNVNSDLRWYRIVPWLFERWGNSLFYDYTKNPAVLSPGFGDEVLPGKGYVAGNYLLVYSLNEKSNMDTVLEFLERGGNASVVTNRKKGQPVRGEWLERPMVDGDVTDDLWSHRPGAWIDLSAKGSARKDMEANPFVRMIY